MKMPGNCIYELPGIFMSLFNKESPAFQGVKNCIFL
ncbi:hypothetical protein G159_03920 [Planococcus glaciei CHR43]|nr:hypothetical protein G159_03920 [Planococcus glaciei CHR43]